MKTILGLVFGVVFGLLPAVAQAQCHTANVGVGTCNTYASVSHVAKYAVVAPVITTYAPVPVALPTIVTPVLKAPEPEMPVSAPALTVVAAVPTYTYAVSAVPAYTYAYSARFAVQNHHQHINANFGHARVAVRTFRAPIVPVRVAPVLNVRIARPVVGATAFHLANRVRPIQVRVAHVAGPRVTVNVRR